CTCSVMVSSRASWTLTPSREVCTWPRAVFTFSMVPLTLPSIGPVASATSRSVRVAASTVCRSRRIGTASAITSTANAPDTISSAISQPLRCTTFPPSAPHAHSVDSPDHTVEIGRPLRDSTRSRDQAGPPPRSETRLNTLTVACTAGHDPPRVGGGAAAGAGEPGTDASPSVPTQVGVRTNRFSTYSSRCQQVPTPVAPSGGQPAAGHRPQPAFFTP